MRKHDKADKVLVMGAAIIRDGRVLVARRTAPLEVAGGWEFPGGKVEPGEDPEVAIVREIREELGCGITVTGHLAGQQPIKDGYTLRVARAELTAGEPLPHEHDAIRWLGPEELGDVRWLEPDLPFLDELRETLLDGRRLDGGNVGGAVRIGKTVRRPTGPWTPAVHALLDHLERHGLPCAPRVLGTDARGREVLSYLPGHIIDVDTEQLTDGQLVSLVTWTRRLHEATATFTHPGPWRLLGSDQPGSDRPGSDRPGSDRPEVIAHNDIAPYNACFEGDQVTGVFDWDLAGPATALRELAFLVWPSVPLYRDIGATESARRLELVASTYGRYTAREILHAVPQRIQDSIDFIRSAVEQGDETMRNLAALGEPERTEVALADLVDRIPLIEKELS